MMLTEQRRELLERHVIAKFRRATESVSVFDFVVCANRACHSKFVHHFIVITVADFKILLSDIAATDL